MEKYFGVLLLLVFSAVFGYAAAAYVRTSDGSFARTEVLSQQEFEGRISALKSEIAELEEKIVQASSQIAGWQAEKDSKALEMHEMEGMSPAQ